MTDLLKAAELAYDEIVRMVGHKSNYGVEITDPDHPWFEIARDLKSAVEKAKSQPTSLVSAPKPNVWVVQFWAPRDSINHDFTWVWFTHKNWSFERGPETVTFEKQEHAESIAAAQREKWEKRGVKVRVISMTPAEADAAV